MLTTIEDILKFNKTLILESFKDDVISAYKKNGINVSTDNDFLNAVTLFNSDNDVKNAVKKRLQNSGGNLGISVANKFKEPSDFIDYISQIYDILETKREEQQRHHRKKNNKEINESDDFYVYGCKTFESAKSAAQAHTGNLERLGNKKIEEKYGIDVPEPAHYYTTSQSNKEYFEWMKKVPFFMNPSWCICSNKQYWKSYNLNCEENEPPKCFIVISKKYPNLRFCIVKARDKYETCEVLNNEIYSKKTVDDKIREVRDPWQVGGGKNPRERGLELIKLAFGDKLDELTKNSEPVTTVTKLNSTKEILEEEKEQQEYFTSDFTSLKDGRYIFRRNYKLISFKTDMPSLEDGYCMFDKCNSITTFESDISNIRSAENMFWNCYHLSSLKFNGGLPKLKNGNGMFYACVDISSFDYDLRNLETGEQMFYGCSLLKTFDTNLDNLQNAKSMFNFSGLKSFNSNLSKLEDGTDMFRNSKELTQFNSDLSSLKTAKGMFHGCRLDLKSLMNITKTLPYENGVITIGLDPTLFETPDTIMQVEKCVDIITHKGWKVQIDGNKLNRNSNYSKFVTNGSSMFKERNDLKSIISDFPMLLNGDSMFCQCERLVSWKGKLPRLINGNEMFYGCAMLKNFTSELPNLQTGDSMFFQCSLRNWNIDLPMLSKGDAMFMDSSLRTFSANLNNLTNASSMFYGCLNLSHFDANLPNLSNGSGMFDGCSELITWNIQLPKLVNGNEMFYTSGLRQFNSNLSSLQNGDRMFAACRLDLDSLKNISETINNYSGNITIGLDKNILNAENTKKQAEQYIDVIKQKGWNIYVQFN